MSGPIERVAVIGAGTMGHGIAQVAAQAGCQVALFDALPTAVEHGLARVRETLDGGIARGKLTPAERAATLSRLRGSSSLAEAAADADLVIEAVPERLELKRQVFGELAGLTPPHALLATNTSSLSVSTIQEATPCPERVLGLHFFNPVHIMALVELVRGRATAPAAIDSALAFVRRLGKEPIVVNDAPGFASSRLGVALGLEAMRMVEQGVADAEAIDRAMELGYRHPMGPLRLTDLVGLDVRLGIAESLHEALSSEVFRPPDILRRMVADGKLGKKSGEGFYRW
ncbi:MAG: 3-hydroxyacyl-CoA dehydrogenase family protein [Longimicrobiales bacterium]